MADDLKRMKLKVHIRLRPAECETKDVIVKPEHRLMYLVDPIKGHTSEFVFDRVFDSDAKQDDIFSEVGRPLVDHVLQGFNACCFAYGQTGSGKTYSMFGKENGDWEERGIIPRAAEQLFKRVADMKAGNSTRLSVFVSFMEIYLEQVRDLAHQAVQRSPPNQGRRVSMIGNIDRNNLEIYEDPSGVTLVKDLTYVEVSSVEDVMALLKAGSALRQTAATGQNDTSSRSHTLFTISVVQYQDGHQPITGRFHMVDLAGSERLSKSYSEGVRLTETKAINKSLTALGKVVMTLAAQQQDMAAAAAAGSGGEQRHVPFRDSKLTRLLKDSLQGNCHTSLLAALNPHPDNFEECFNTLQFAVRCQSINTAPHVNVLGQGGPQDAAIERLQQQVAQLKQELEFTHAHYQKLIESVAGPGWAADLGPLERSEAGLQPGEDAQGAAGAGRGAKAGAGQDGAGGSSMLQDSSSSSKGAAGSKEGGRSIASLEAQVKRLESQLGAAQAKLTAADGRLMAKRVESEEFRDRMLTKDFQQVGEMKRLRDQLRDSKAALQESSGLAAHREAELQKRFDDELARLSVDNEALRSQLASLSGSVSNMIESRSSKVVAAQRQRDALLGDAERKLKEQVALTVAEKDRQKDNLKQQSTYHLARKAEEIAALRAELQQLQTKSEADACAFRAEAEYLIAYSEKVTEILRRMEAGMYGVVEQGGLRQFKVPQRDKPGALQEDRLRYLSTAVDGVSRLVAATAAAAAAGSTSRSLPSSLPPTAGSSRVQSAVGTQRSAHNFNTSLQLSKRGSDVDGADLLGALCVSPEMEALKVQWEASLRESITNQVVSDLKGDPTVEYIRSLESQLARYRQEVQVEKKRSNEMTVALRSVQRVHSRPGSAINRAISGGVLAPSPTWGLGHTSSSVHTATVGRPVTASATMRSGYGQVARTGSWNAGPGLHSMSSGSSTHGGYIRENGLSY